MKKRFWIPMMAVAAALVITACSKNDDTPRCISNTLARDQQIIDSILGPEKSTYTFDAQSNLYYRIDDEGTGNNKPTTDSLVAFNYIGRVLGGASNNVIIDSLTVKEPATNKLGAYSRVIVAVYSLQKIKPGGTVSVIIPSSQLFGCVEAQGVNKVPANAQLIYQYNLTEVKK